MKCFKRRKHFLETKDDGWCDDDDDDDDDWERVSNYWVMVMIMKEFQVSEIRQR